MYIDKYYITLVVITNYYKNLWCSDLSNEMPLAILHKQSQHMPITMFDMLQ